MASKQIKRIEKTLASETDSIIEQGRRVWLAGLGAVSIAQKRGRQAYATAQQQGRAIYTKLIVEGSDLQTRTLTLAREAGADAKAQAKGVFAPLTASVEKTAEHYSALVDSGVAKVLHRLGVPTKRELDDLRKRIASLSRQVKPARAFKG